MKLHERLGAARTTSGEDDMSENQPESAGDADMRERIHLNLPVGATSAHWARAMDVARSFATTYAGKPHGPRHGTCYRYRDGEKYAVWWTASRAVSVWWEP